MGLGLGTEGSGTAALSITPSTGPDEEKSDCQGKTVSGRGHSRWQEGSRAATTYKHEGIVVRSSKPGEQGRGRRQGGLRHRRDLGVCSSCVKNWGNPRMSEWLHLVDVLNIAVAAVGRTGDRGRGGQGPQSRHEAVTAPHLSRAGAGRKAYWKVESTGPRPAQPTCGQRVGSVLETEKQHKNPSAGGGG